MFRIFMILILLSNLCFGFDAYSDSTEARVFVGSAANNIYVGTEISVKLSNDITLIMANKVFLENMVKNTRFSPASEVYKLGFKYKMFGYETFCKHRVINPENIDEEIIANDIYTPVLHRFYLDVYQHEDAIFNFDKSIPIQKR